MEMAKQLHGLALRYWSEGRTEDARRVAREAAALVDRVDPESTLMTEITSTLDDLRRHDQT